MDRANYAENQIESSLALEVLIAYIVDSFLICLAKIVQRPLRRELEESWLSRTFALCDERFLVH